MYIDAGRFGGLAETEGEAIRFPIAVWRDGHLLGEPEEAMVLAGPTCDSADTPYEQEPVLLPGNLGPGEYLDLCLTGAYTNTYSSVGCNGFPPLSTVTFASSCHIW